MFGSSQELALLDQSQRLCRSADRLFGVHFVLDRLQMQGDSKTHITLAKHTIYSFARKFEAACYTVLTDQMVIICAKDHHVALFDFIESLHGIFDHLTRGLKGDRDAIRLFDLEKDPRSFAEACEAIHQHNLDKVADRSLGDRTETTGRIALDAHTLDRIDRALRHCDISSLIQRQSICNLPGDRQPVPVFTEYFVSMDNLRQVIAPDVDLIADPDLFRSLMRTIDRRLFHVLREDHRTVFSRPVSFNLAVATLTSREFLTFAEEVLNQSRNNLVIELDIRDVLANLDDYFAALPFLKGQGSKVLLQSLGINHLKTVDIRGLQADLFKFTWRVGYDRNRHDRDIIAQKVGQFGANRCILSHCDSEDAIDFGYEVGIKVFQGRQIDRLMTGPRLAGTSAPDAFIL